MIYKLQARHCFCLKSLNEIEQIDLNLCNEINEHFQVLGGGGDYFATYWRG